MDFYTSEQLSKLQEEVSEGTVISNQQQPPNQAELFLVSSKNQFLWIQKEKLLFKKAVLYLCLEDISNFWFPWLRIYGLNLTSVQIWGWNAKSTPI